MAETRCAVLTDFSLRCICSSRGSNVCGRGSPEGNTGPYRRIMGGGAFAKLCMLCSPLSPLLYLSSPLSFSFLLPAPSSLYPVPSCSVPVPFPSLWRRGLEERLSARNGCGRSPAAKRFLVHFQSKSAHSMYCNLNNSFTFTFTFLYVYVSRK